jgi:CTP synthase
MEKIYGAPSVSERHRHRYEFANAYRKDLEAAGLKVCGTSPDGKLVEAVEAEGSPFHLGVQFHPEFKSRPDRAHPIFREFIKEALYARS